MSKHKGLLAKFAVGGLSMLAIAQSGCDRSDGRVENPSNVSPTAHVESERPFDPVATNGPIFDEWPDPKLALVVTGAQQGYLEPCGCAGLENQKGGLARRHSLIDHLRQRGWEPVPLDAGEQIRRFGRQAEMKLQFTVDALSSMQYEAAALGSGDLAMSADDLLGVIANFGGDESRMVSANVAIFEPGAGYPPQSRVVEREGLRIGVTSVICPSFSKGIETEDVIITPPEEALGGVVSQLADQSCDLTVLLAQATIDEAMDLAREFPFDLVFAMTNVGEPPAEPLRVDGRETLVIELGHKSMYAAVVGYYPDGSPRFRYQRVPLDSRFEISPQMRELLAAYQVGLEETGFEGLGIRPVAHPRSFDVQTELAGTFAGARACAECHTKAYAKWQDSPHAKATETLVELDPPRQFDPECISCHATGWDPQQYVPFETGYRSIAETAHLTNNGCENCHGPAAAHVEAERVRGAQRDLGLIEELRASLRLTSATADLQVCRKCHDGDNSPDFDYETYWPKIAHPGKD